LTSHFYLCILFKFFFVKSELRDFVVNRFFKESSEEERHHAELLMQYQVFDILHLHLNCLILLSSFLFFGLTMTCGFVCFGKCSEQTRWKSEAAIYSDACL
jgi:hypothetical protein